MTKPSAGARFIGMGGNLGNYHVGNGSAPTTVHWSEAVAILVTGLSSIAKLGGPEVRLIAVDTLSRASEAVPSVMKDANVRAAISVGASLAETRPSPAPLPAMPPPPVTDHRLLEELRLTRAAIDELKGIPAPPHLAPPVSAPVFDAAYYEQRIAELEKKRRLAQMRGDRANARTTSTQITQARKRLRELLQTNTPFNPVMTRKD